MNLEIGEANIYKDETEISETRDSDAAVIKSIVGYSSTLKNRCIAYIDSPESDFSYEQLAELVKAYRVYSRSCGDIVRLIYEFYDYDEINNCEKTVDITRDNYSEHIAAAKDAVNARLDECRERYNKTFYTEDEEEYAKILLEVRTERRSLEELLRLFESLNSSFETYFDRLDSEGMDLPVINAEDTDTDESDERPFNISDYPIEEDEYPAAGNTDTDMSETSAEEETEIISERSSTLEDILAEFAEDEEYAESYKSGGDEYDYSGDEYGYSGEYSFYTEGESDEDYENYSFKAEPEDTEEAEEIPEYEEPEEITQPAEEEAEEYPEEQSGEQIEFELPELPSETDLSSETGLSAEDTSDAEEEKTDGEKFIDFIENSKFETYKAVFEVGGDIRREINVTTIAESGFTKLHGKDKWSESSYINDVFGIYRQYTSISADDSEIRRGIIRAGAVKRISDFLMSIGIEASAENIMQLDRLCPIEFSAPDAAVIETDSSYILAVFKAVYSHLRSGGAEPIAIAAEEKKKEEPESYAEEKFFGFGSGDDYEDYETSRYVAADYEAAAREFEDMEDFPDTEDTAENIPENNSDNGFDSFESGVSERTEEEAYEEYTEPEPEPIKELGTPVTMILNGKEAVYDSWAEAERAFCEYAIKAKPFAMALINRRNDTLNGQKVFNRATYDMPNTISLSNGLQAYAASCKEDFLEICGRVMNICSIEKDIYKIIESGAAGNDEL